MPEMALKCIESWKKYFPDYEIKEWNEANFDINCCPYIKEAYNAKKWAFVSDYARFKILNEHGGLYFDTDVEVIKPMVDVILEGPYMGCESSTQSTLKGKVILTKVNPGLGMAAEPNMSFIKKILNIYESRHFIKGDGSQDITTIVETTTSLLKENGFSEKKCNTIQKVCHFNIYPSDFFCPLDYCTGKVIKTENTRTIHWYSSTWFTQGQRVEKRIKQFASNFGKVSYILERSISFPVRVWNKFQNVGFQNGVKFIIRKIGRK